MCGGFEFSKRTLIGLNIIYIFVAFLLIGVAAAAKKAAIISSLPVVGGIIFCGVILLFVAIVGLYGAFKQHQVALFAYMVVLFSIFVIQFSVACASLAAQTDDELEILGKLWKNADEDTKNDVEKTLDCCGWDSPINKTATPDATCAAACFQKDPATCNLCKDRVSDKVDYAFNSSGGVGLFFAFTELVAILYAHKYRVQLKALNQGIA